MIFYRLGLIPVGLVVSLVSHAALLLEPLASVLDAREH
jgi:hypothetical protein